jgi:hypothetical protein
VEVFEGMKDEFARLKVSVEPLVKILRKDPLHG